MTAFRVGDKARIKMSMSSAGKYKDFRGEVVEIVGLSWGVYAVKIVATGHIIYNVSPTSIEEYSSLDPLKSLEDDRERLMKKVADVDMKISYMKESGADVFDYTEFRIFNAIKESTREGLSDIEKAKVIAEAIRKKK